MSTEAMKMALEALKDNQHLVADNERHAYVMEYNAIIEKLEEALAKQEQGEPDYKTLAIQLQQQRTWVGLTDDEVYKIAFALEGEHWKKIADAIEAKLKEKNT
jgi:hypothetical protein